VETAADRDVALVSDDRDLSRVAATLIAIGVRIAQGEALEEEDDE